MTIGILAFQGNVAEHRQMIALLGKEAIDVRSVADAQTVTHLIIPGGESTVIARFLEQSGVGALIQEKVKNHQLAVFGTCAGAIVLATTASGKNAPQPLKLIDIDVSRNAYGSQIDSFESELSVTGIDKPVHVSFIRAPQITRVGETCRTLATYKNMPVIVQSNRILVSTCHPELRSDPQLHAFFLTI